MESEIGMVEKKETSDIVDRPSDKSIVGVKWIYKTKLNLDVTVQKHKARLATRSRL